MKTFVHTILALSTALAVDNSQQLYADYTVVNCNSDGGVLDYLHSQGADIWKQTGDSVEFLMSPDMAKDMDTKFPQVKRNVVLADVQAVLNKEMERLNAVADVAAAAASSTINDEYFNDYKPFESARDAMRGYCEANSSLCKYIPSIGKSHEGRDIFALRITKGSNNGKRVIYMQAQQHAREWITNPTVAWFLYQLVELNGKDAQVTRLLTQVEFVIVPFVNPDGYVYSWTTDRLWRKNRRNNRNGTFGVDPNRNWDYNWSQAGASSNPSSNVYHGPAVESEPEVKSTAAFFRSLKPIVAIDWHSYTQLILRPFGDTRRNSIHERQLKQITERMAQVIKNVNGKVYTAQKGIDLYPTTGTGGDFFYVSEFKDDEGTYRPYGLTMELRPDENSPEIGFVLPPEEILPTAQENFPAMLTLVEYALRNVLYVNTDTDTE